MEKRPVIGLNVSLAHEGDTLKIHAPLSYAEAIARAGGLPLFVPSVEDFSLIPELVRHLDGAIFIGGKDYLPSHYGGADQFPEELVHPLKDRFDFAWGKYIMQRTSLPVLGICGGMQLMALIQGGTLIQDIERDWTLHPPLPHNEENRAYRHLVSVEEGSLLAKIIGNGEGFIFSTNSHHHQAVHPQKTGIDLYPVAKTGDGIVEAIAPTLDSPWAKEERFLIGVQWHPERLWEEERHRLLFIRLVEAALAFRQSRS